MENLILRNAAQCRKCGDLIESKYRHDFVRCSCGEIAVDGGHEYLRRMGNASDIIDMSIMDDGDHLTRREYLRWGVNYTKDMNPLPETEWRLIKDLNTEHIQAIIDGGYASRNPFYEDLFLTELIYRESNENL